MEKEAKKNVKGIKVHAYWMVATNRPMQAPILIYKTDPDEQSARLTTALIMQCRSMIIHNNDQPEMGFI